MRNTVKTKPIAIIVIALLLASIAITTVTKMPVSAQTTGVNIGTPTLAYTGGPPPAGVTPQVLVPTVPYLSFVPNPIGVGQVLTVNVWEQPALTVARAHTGYTVTITNPDGTTTTVGPFDSYLGDTTAYFTWVPTVAGNYTLQFSFAGDYYPAGTYTDGFLNYTGPLVSGAAPFTATQSCYYEPSITAKYTLIVQQNPVASVQPSALPGPGDYWSRPIQPGNREWWVIGGNDPNNQVGGGTGTPGWPDNTNVYTSVSSYAYVPYVTGPTSAHIVWRMQGYGYDGIYGGLIDGAATTALGPGNDFTGASVTSGASGPGQSGNPNIVFNGRCYETITEPYQGVTQPVWTCFDLQTGKIYWQLTNQTHTPTLISYSQQNPPVIGGAFRADRTQPSLVYIGASAVSNLGLVIKYNPVTGAIIANSTIPLTSGTLYADPYVLSVQNIGNTSSPNYRLINWTLDGITPGLSFQSLPGIQANFATYNLISNISWPFSTLGNPDFESMISATTYSATSLATGTAVPSPGSTSDVYVAAASLVTGQLLWNVSSGVPYPIYTGNEVADHGLYAIRFDDGYWYAYNLDTGALAWKSQLSSYAWGVFGAYSVQSAYGLLYYGQYDGVVAYNWTNGQIAWWYQAPAVSPFESDFNNGTASFNGSVYAFYGGAVVADGMYYTYAIEHSPTAPIERGWGIYCINATTGALVWETLGAMNPGVVSDGYLTAVSIYDGYMNTFGMGLSATTVSSPQTEVVAGHNAVISGTVVDQSPAQPGTPCVSDASMGDWMAYLHQQAACPANVTGVPISIDTIDPNGNYMHIATVTTDGTSGTFGYTWTTPTITGEYKITATYAGDDSYSYSTATTYADVVAPTATASPTATATASNLATTTDLLTYMIVGIIAIIIAIAIVGLVLFRKK
jgi:outer membrane protein assembly factor BamB